MGIKKAIGRRPKVNYKIMIKLADALAHNSSITDSCRYARISRSTYYDYLNNNEVFAETMTTAKDNRNKSVFSFLTVP